MSYELIKSADWKRTLKFTLDAKELDEKYTENLKMARKLFSIPGFRPGRVPLQIVEKRLREQLIEDTLSNLQEDAFENAVKEENLQLVGKPHFSEDTPFEKGKEYKFSVEFEVEPEFELPEYKGLKLQRYRVAVSDEDIEAELHSLRYRNAKWEDTPDREAEHRDAIFADITVMHDGVEVQKKENERFTLTPRALPQFDIEDIEERFKGVKQGDTREFICKAKGDSIEGVKDGDDITVGFHINKVQALVLPEITDEYMVQFDFENIEHFKATTRSRLLQMRSENEEKRFRQSIMDKLLENLHFDVPKELRETKINDDIRKTKMQYMRMGIDLDKIGDAANELFGNVEQEAERSIREYFVLQKIADKEKIFATEREMMDEVNALARQYGMSPVKMREKLEELGMLAQIRWDIIEKKTVNMLIDKAEVTEVDAPAFTDEEPSDVAGDK